MQAYRDKLVRFGRMLHESGYIAAAEGNLSVRLDRDTVLATPTGVCKGLMRPEDLVLVDMNGERLRESQTTRRNVSSEIAMHMLIYRTRQDVTAVVHAHPPTATGFAVAGIALDQPLLPEIVLVLGKIPLARYATPGTQELSDALAPLIEDHDAILMASHGVVTCGDDLERAYLNMEMVEQFARIVLVARQLGDMQTLSDAEVCKLTAMRAQYFRNAQTS